MSIRQSLAYDPAELRCLARWYILKFALAWLVEVTAHNPNKRQFLALASAHAASLFFGRAYSLSTRLATADPAVTRAVDSTKAQTGSRTYPQTDAERRVEVVPINLDYANGPRRYGAVGDGSSNDQDAWNSMGKVAGYHFVDDGVYRFTGKVQTQTFITVEGATRQNTIIQSSGFPDYVLEIGRNLHGANPNVGALRNIRFLAGTVANTGMLHMQQLSHMWRLDGLLFQGCQCPALVIDNCWDSNYSNIDILSCGNSRGDAATNAAVIVRNSSNNIYFRGVRIEQCPSGCIFVGENAPLPVCTGAIYLVTGKIDMGFIPQFAACINVAQDGQLFIDDYEISGANRQYVFDVRGQLKLGNVEVGGGSGMPAAILDRRAWQHINPTTVKGAAAGSFGPTIPVLDLGQAYFQNGSIFINQRTPAVLESKVFPIRSVDTLSVKVNGEVGTNTITIGTDLSVRSNNQYDGCYLVLNSKGTHASSRRKILTTFVGGNLVLQGISKVELSDDYSIEYCGSHATPMLTCGNIQMDQGMDLFAVLYSGIVIRDEPVYVASNSGKSWAGTTVFSLSGLNLPQRDLAGYFLFDDATGEPYLIAYGLDRANRIGVMYDRVSDIDVRHHFSIMGGYEAGVEQRGGSYEWSFARFRHSVPIQTADHFGFDKSNIPLWAFALSGRPVNLLLSDTVQADGTQGRDFIVSATRNFAMGLPLFVDAGDRISFTIRNISEAAVRMTWNPAFKMAAWSELPSGFNRSIEFRIDRGALFEVARTPSDVPN